MIRKNVVNASNIEFHTREVRKAKKNHKCSECEAKIKVRDRYFYTSGKTTDGDWFELKFCRECSSDVNYTPRKEITICKG